MRTIVINNTMYGLRIRFHAIKIIITIFFTTMLFLQRVIISNNIVQFDDC